MKKKNDTIIEPATLGELLNLKTGAVIRAEYHNGKPWIGVVNGCNSKGIPFVSFHLDNGWKSWKIDQVSRESRVEIISTGEQLGNALTRIDESIKSLSRKRRDLLDAAIEAVR